MKSLILIAFSLLGFSSFQTFAAKDSHEIVKGDAKMGTEPLDTNTDGAIAHPTDAMNSEAAKVGKHEGGHSESHAHKSQSGANLELLKQPERDVANGTRPSTPVLQEPEALQKVSGTNVTLKWQAVEGAAVYHVQVASDPNFKWLIADEANFNQTSFQPQGLKLGQNYFWRVAARNPANYAGRTRSFFATSSFMTR